MGVVGEPAVEQGTSAQVHTDAVEADRLLKEAQVLRRSYVRADTDEALAGLRRARDFWHASGTTLKAALASRLMGLLLLEAGSWPDARECFEQGLEWARQSEDPSAVSRIASDLGNLLALLGEVTRAEALCDEALRLAAKSGNREATARALVCAGEVAYNRDEAAEALAFYSRAESVSSSTGDLRGRAEALLLIGYVHSDLRRFAKASSAYYLALDLWNHLNDRRGRALVLVALGRLHLRLSEYQLALNNFAEARQLVAPIEDGVWTASILAGIGSVYFETGEPDLALPYWTEARELFKLAELRVPATEVLLSIAAAHFRSGSDGRALTHLDEALALARELKSARLESDAHRLAGRVYRAQELPEKALEAFELARSLQEADDDPRIAAETLADIGSAYEELGASGPASEHFELAIARSRDVRDRIGEARGNYGLARLARARGDLHRSRELIERAIDLTESVRREVALPALRSSYRASVDEYFDFYIDLLMSLHLERPRAGHDVEAFEASERSRARMLVEMLAAAERDRETGVEGESTLRAENLKRRLDAAIAEWMLALADRPEDLEEVSRSMSRLSLEYERAQAESRSLGVGLEALGSPAPMSLAEVQTDLLDDDTVLLHYSLGEPRSFLWIVSPTRFESHVLTSRAAIEDSARRVYQQIAARRSRRGAADPDPRESMDELSRMLALTALGGMSAERVVVVADGFLHHLPFAVLPLPLLGSERSMPLISSHEIAYLPSAGALGALRDQARRREPAPRELVVMADPVFSASDPRLPRLRAGPAVASRAEPWQVTAFSRQRRALDSMGLFGLGRGGVPRLPATGREAESIMGWTTADDSMRLVGLEASRLRALHPSLGEYRILHLATHSLVNSRHPGLSGVLLSLFDFEGKPTNGFLSLHDIYELKLSAELVVLSACSTALGKDAEGEGLVGLVHGFLLAGSERVMASLWEVDDDATAALMSTFYDEMLNRSRSPTAAMRHAQLQLMEQERWAAPYYWAAFVSQGEWR